MAMDAEDGVRFIVEGLIEGGSCPGSVAAAASAFSAFSAFAFAAFVLSAASLAFFTLASSFFGLRGEGVTSLAVSEMEERAVLEAIEGLRLGVASFSFLGARGAILRDLSCRG